MIFAIIGVFLILALAAWWYGFYIRNDLSVPDANISKFKNALLVFPHADDEVFSASGLIGALNAQGTKITLAILTKGERGNYDAHYDEKLKEVRSHEAQAVSKILGISELIQEDFGDGELKNKEKQLSEYISRLIANKKPDLILTYDLSGLYGHDDHITVSKIVTDFIRKTNFNAELWYVTFPKRTIDMLKLPEHMASDLEFKLKREAPNVKIFALPYIIKKIRAIYAYKSQLASFRNAVPVKQIPLWFYHSMSIYEYFHKVDFLSDKK